MRRPPAASPPLLRGLAPIADPAARVLILGSMPGGASLAAGQYYAHPRNLFWPLLGALLDFDPAAPYPARVAALRTAGIALWDVIGACRRVGSLDARIDAASVEVNDFGSFFAQHPSLRLVGFNGATAARQFRRHVLPAHDRADLRYLQLPSTSPANASIPLARKRAAWAELAATVRAPAAHL